MLQQGTVFTWSGGDGTKEKALELVCCVYSVIWFKPSLSGSKLEFALKTCPVCWSLTRSIGKGGRTIEVGIWGFVPSIVTHFATITRPVHHKDSPFDRSDFGRSDVYDDHAGKNRRLQIQSTYSTQFFANLSHHFDLTNTLATADDPIDHRQWHQYFADSSHLSSSISSSPFITVATGFIIIPWACIAMYGHLDGEEVFQPTSHLSVRLGCPITWI